MAPKGGTYPSFRYIPYPYCALGAAGGEPLTIRRDRYRGYRACVVIERHPMSPIKGLVYSYSPDVRDENQPAAIGGDSEIVNYPAAVCGSASLTSGLGVPDADCSVAASRGQPVAVRRDRYGVHGSPVASQGDPFLPGGRIPDADCSVAAAGSQPAAVGRDRHSMDGITVADQYAPQRGVRQIWWPPSIHQPRAAVGITQRVNLRCPLRVIGRYPTVQHVYHGRGRFGRRQQVRGAGKGRALAGRAGRAYARQIASRGGGTGLFEPRSHPPQITGDIFRLALASCTNKVLDEVVPQIVIARRHSPPCHAVQAGPGFTAVIGGWETISGRIHEHVVQAGQGLLPEVVTQEVADDIVESDPPS